MRRRDRQNELVVAVIVVGAMAMALAFGIILTLGSQNDGESESNTTRTQTATNTRLPIGVPPTEITIVTPLTAVPTNSTTLAPTEIAEDVSPTASPSVSPSASPSATPTEANSSTSQPESTERISTEPALTPSRETVARATFTPTDSASLENTTAEPTDRPTRAATRTHEASATQPASPTSTRRATNTTNPTRTNTASRTPTATTQPSSTPSRTPTITASPTRTNTASRTPTATITASPTRTSTPTRRPTLTRTNTPTRTLTITPFPTATITPTIPTVTPSACIPPTDWVPYVVEIGDTLFEIAQATGVRLDFLREANCLTGSNIQAGQILFVPPDSISSLPTSEILPPIGCDFQTVIITEPRPGQVFVREFEVRGIADFPNFGRYELQIRDADGPPEFQTLLQNINPVISENKLGEIEPSRYPEGYYWVRLMVYSNQGYELSYCAIQVYFSRP